MCLTYIWIHIEFLACDWTKMTKKPIKTTTKGPGIKKWGKKNTLDQSNIVLKGFHIVYKIDH